MSKDRKVLGRKIVQQVQELLPGRKYALVINHPLTVGELQELKELCQAAHVFAMILTDTRVVPLAQLATVIGTAATAEIAQAVAEAPREIVLPAEMGARDG